MADIDVERKGGPGIWPWIIGLIVLALLAWLLIEWLGDDDDVVVDEPVAGVVEPAPVAPVAPTEAGPGAVPAPVQQYLTTCAPREPQAMGLDHQYTSNCVQQLVAATEAVMQSPNLQGVDVQAQLQEARQRAERLAQSPQASTEHAGMTRDAFTSVAAVLDGMQDARYPELGTQVDQLRQAAQSVQPTGTLLDQREPVQDFFRQAGDVLNRMAMAPAAA